MMGVRIVLGICAIGLACIFGLIMKKINKVGRSNDELCLSLYFCAVMVGILMACDFTIFISTIIH